MKNLKNRQLTILKCLLHGGQVRHEGRVYGMSEDYDLCVKAEKTAAGSEETKTVKYLDRIVEKMKSKEILTVLLTVYTGLEYFEVVGENQYGHAIKINDTLIDLLYDYLRYEISLPKGYDTAKVRISLLLPNGDNFDYSGDFQGDSRHSRVEYLIKSGRFY